MHKVFCDSSSLILLTKLDLINYLIDFGNLIVSEKVFNETVIKGNSKGKEDAFIISKLISEQKIKVVKLNNRKFFAYLMQNFRLDEGEAEVISLAYENKNSILLTDDNEAIKACKFQGITYMTSLLLLLKLVRDKQISLETGLNKLEKLNKIGFYSKELIEHVSQVMKRGVE